MKVHAGSRWQRRAKNLAIALGLLTSLTGAAPRLEAKKRNSRLSIGLPAQIHQLILKAYGLSIQEAKPTTDEIQNLTIRHLDRWIQNRAPNFVEARRELEREFGTLRYPFYVQCSAFEARWKSRQVIGAGYSLGWSKYDRVNVVALYEKSGNRTRRIALTHFVPRTNLNYIVVPPDSAGDFRFFIWGTRPGKAQPRLTAILYSSNRRGLKPLWEKKNLFDGKIEVQNNQVVLTYVDETSFVNAVQQNTLPHRHQAIYQLLPQGLKFESERNIPF
jgi:hypothetical protein